MKYEVRGMWGKRVRGVRGMRGYEVRGVRRMRGTRGTTYEGYEV